MSDTALDKIINVGTAAARAAFTPSPGTTRQLFIWVDNDSFPSSDPATWVWDSGSSAWIQINTAGAGSVTTGVTLTNNQLVVGAGSSTIKVSDLTGDVTTSGGVATTIANAAVTLAKIANAAANSKWLGSGDAGSGAAYTENSFGIGLSVSGTTVNATGDGFWTTVTAASDQDISSNTTPATDNELFFTMTAAKLYVWDLYFVYGSPAGGGTPDLKLTFAGPAILTGNWVALGGLTNADGTITTTTITALTTAAALGTATTPRLQRATGWAYSTGGGSGSSGFQVQWSQNTSNVNATRRYAGSCIRYRLLGG